MDTTTLTAEAVAELLSLSRQAEALAATFPELEIPPQELAEALAQVRRLGMRLGAIEEALAALGPA